MINNIIKLNSIYVHIKEKLTRNQNQIIIIINIVIYTFLITFVVHFINIVANNLHIPIFILKIFLISSPVEFL